MPLQKTCGTKTVWLLHLCPSPHRLLSEEQTQRSLYSFYVYCGSISHGLVIHGWKMLLWKHSKYHLLFFGFWMPIILLVISVSDKYLWVKKWWTKILKCHEMSLLVVSKQLQQKNIVMCIYSWTSDFVKIKKQMKMFQCWQLFCLITHNNLKMETD